jgi:hypothetical protein
MPMLIILITVIFLSLTSFVASADGSRTLALRKPEEKPSPTASLCARKIALGPEGRDVGCLMQKHRGRDHMP